MIEGPSKNYNYTKAMMYGDEATWFALMNHLHANQLTMVAQVEAGAELIQIFDSWVGALNVQDYRYYIKPSTDTSTELKPKYDVPVIMFGVQAI